MAAPADPPISQRYTAGSCTLSVEWTRSPLSQWSECPIVSQLTFELWLETKAALGEDSLARDSSNDSSRRSIVATGDRTELQAITRYFQYQTRSLLALSQINLTTADKRPEQAQSRQPPQSLQITSPLGYLQICDISTVLSQFERRVNILPVELGMPSAAPSNVVSLFPSKKAIPPKRSRYRTQSPQRRQSGNTKIWASSAAAALFAVGLTTTFWSRDLMPKEPPIKRATPTDPNTSNTQPLPRSAAPEETTSEEAISEEAISEETTSESDSYQAASPPPSNDKNPSTESFAASQSSDIPEAASIEPALDLVVSPETQQVISQVQAYFVRQWQGGTVGPLLYRLQLSTTGEVVGFVALNNAAEDYRDRILPLDNAPAFAVPYSDTENPQVPASALNLRIILNQNGRIEVAPF